MKKITKSLMTLALLVLGGVSANAEERVIAEIDYSTVADKDLTPEDVPEGATYGVKDGLFTIENTSSDGNAWDLQPAILEGFNVKQGYSYRITVNYKSTTAGNINFTWGSWSATAASYGQPIKAEEDFTDFVQTYNNVGFSVTGNAAHVLWQCRSIIGTMYIKKVTVVEIVPDVSTTPVASVTYGNLNEVTPIIYGKPDSGTPAVLTPDENGVYSVKNTLDAGDDHATQFWITAPYSLPSGQKFYVEFEYKADVAATGIATQTHGKDPGSYIIWHCIGNIDFAAPTEATDTEDAKDGWKKFTGETKIENDMSGWQSIAFNLNKHIENTYYFRNIKLKVPELNSAVSLGIGEEGWITCSFEQDVNLGEGVGFAATYNGTSVELLPVTEVPANNAVIIEGTEGTVKNYTFEIIESAESISDNDLQVSDGTAAGNGSIYVLAKGKYGVGFYKLASGQTVPAGKAYLEVTDGNAREFIGFAGDATTVKAVETLKKSGAIYNLAGQQVKNAQKGIFIIDGKKVAVK